jgi:hypothetical protein
LGIKLSRKPGKHWRERVTLTYIIVKQRQGSALE